MQVGKKLGATGIAALSLMATAGAASAGGFAVREQSASLMGSAFAGAAAGVDLSSAFWNPAAFGIAQPGFSTQSSYTLITSDTELSNAKLSGSPVAPLLSTGPTATDIDKVGYLSSSYGAYRLNDKTVIGVSITSPFGLSTEADDFNWRGRFHGQAAQMLTVNVSPTLTYEVSPGVHVGAGVQFEYMKLKLWQQGALVIPHAPPALPTIIEGRTVDKLSDNFGVGFTAGILVDTGKHSSIGLGFRSSIEHDLSGKFYSGFPTTRSTANLDTPEMVTLSAVQSLTDQFRVLGTVEWTNWSRIGTIPVSGIVDPNPPHNSAVLKANWDDGWFVSGGLEYDYSPVVTLRGGVAWEKSPIRNATQRLVVLPDSDRVWLSAGASYKYSEATTFDFSYAHVFFEDSHLTRDTLVNNGLILDADVQNDANIFSVGMKTRW